MTNDFSQRRDSLLSILGDFPARKDSSLLPWASEGKAAADAFGLLSAMNLFDDLLGRLADGAELSPYDVAKLGAHVTVISRGLPSDPEAVARSNATTEMLLAYTRRLASS